MGALELLDASICSLSWLVCGSIPAQCVGRICGPPSFQYSDIFPVAMRPGHEPDHSPLSSAEINVLSYISPVCLSELSSLSTRKRLIL
jgi:hypothetical protein